MSARAAYSVSLDGSVSSPDGVLYMMASTFDRNRHLRFRRAIASAADEAAALAAISGELDPYLASVKEQTEPPYLRDVATCEFSLAKARVAFEHGESDRLKEDHAAAGSVRRARGLILGKCEYDVRGIFEAAPENAVPVRRNTLLAILIRPGARNPQIFELLPVGTLVVLDEWTETAGLGCAPELDAMLRELAEHGLAEMRL
jgi:hypothetical protein